jgi:hypothetical protein
VVMFMWLGHIGGIQYLFIKMVNGMRIQPDIL